MKQNVLKQNYFIKLRTFEIPNVDTMLLKFPITHKPGPIPKMCGKPLIHVRKNNTDPVLSNEHFLHTVLPG
jgi:hypothetical protein